METKTTTGEYAIGDAVILIEKSISGDAQSETAKVIDIREVLGKKTYVVETKAGSRKVVGARQIMRAEED
jgi:hypothetical protein